MSFSRAKRPFSDQGFNLKVRYGAGVGGIDFIGGLKAVIPVSHLLTIRLFSGPKKTI
jgi:hypothetical protein